jgi:hypothetical protein
VALDFQRNQIVALYGCMKEEQDKATKEARKCAVAKERSVHVLHFNVFDLHSTRTSRCQILQDELDVLRESEAGFALGSLSVLFCLECALSTVNNSQSQHVFCK